MKKVFSIFLFLLVLFLFIPVVNVRGEEEDVYLIMTNPGEDCSTEMNITWHAKSTGSFLIYTTKDDSSFSNRKTALPNEEELSIYDGTSGGTVKDYKCRVSLKDLTPNTEYIYKVQNNSTSTVHTFKTGGSNDFSFAVVSDIHTYTKIANRLNKANTIIHNMEKVNELSFVLTVGDTMAYGTNRGYWDDFTKSDLAKNYMLAMTPGNHDYYNQSANFLDSSYFNAYTYNPDNGSSASPNTTYFFYYGDVLFISLNSEDACTNASARSNQREWLDKVLSENEEAIYKIIYFHRSMYPGSGSNEGHASTMKGAFQDLIDKYGVDLVFGGHDHVYVRTNKILNGTTSDDSSFGTTYISLPQIGDRASEAGSNMTNIAKKVGGISGGVLINVSDKALEFKLYDDSENLLDSGIISNKMSSVSRSKVNNGLKINYDNKFSNMKITIPNILFQRAYKVVVADKESGKEYVSFRPINQKLEYMITGISDYQKQINFVVTVFYRDGTTFEKEITVKNNIDYGSIDNIEIVGNKMTFSSTLDADYIKEIKIIENDKETVLDIDASSYDFTSSRLDKVKASIQIIAIDGSIAEIIPVDYSINPEDVVFAYPEEVTVSTGSEVVIEIVNSEGLVIDYSYDFDSEYIELRDGKLYSIKEGETIVICKSENFEDIIVRIKISGKRKYLVSYDYNDGITQMNQESVESVNNLTIIQKNPSRDGYEFMGWFTDKECTKPFNVKEELTSDIILYAGWKEKASGCKKASIVELSILILSAFGSCFVFRKKH